MDDLRDRLPQGRVASAVGECAVYGDGPGGPRRLDLADAAAVARGGEGFVWIGLQQATAAQITEVAALFHLPPLAVEDAVQAHQRPKLEVYDDVAFAVLKPVRYVDRIEVVDVGEIAVFVGERFVITVRHGSTDVLGRVRRELGGGLAEEVAAFGPTAVLYRAADLIVDGYERVIERIDVDVDDIEARVFGPGEDDHAERIYNLKREVAEFRRALVPLLRPLEQLAAGGVEHVAPAAGSWFRDVHDHALRAADRVEGIDRLLSDVLQANVARVTVVQSGIALRQNEDTRRISAWAAIALVPTAIAGLYGMNFDNIPELHWKYGYFAVLTVIASACTVLHRLFKRNGWL
ncbi:magnesium and cobalt transport protein CorA [Cellulomonas cellasea]|uniref:Magnesium transport protein CorA n=1 Tax=Cellulomonas cellasea TaxID=43670 RepID=A0A4Y3L024_9CELL|nr:magnesium and cobalt transport protein CorA [Cellulomonas cellasea]GEA88986.1 magnesium transport protein CorA [Cellulomonas cellasea]